MIAHDNAIAARLQSKLRVFWMLNTFEHNRSIPILLQQFEIFPRVGSAKGYSSYPFLGCLLNIILDLAAKFHFEILSEHWIRESLFVPNAFEERYIPRIN